MNFLRLFGRLKSVVIGMVHVKALPGTPQHTLPLTQITEEACREAEVYKAAGVDGLIVENMHDRPYTVDVGAEITAAMAVICATVKKTCPLLPVGVQILCAANQQATAVALASEVGHAVKIPVLVGSGVTLNNAKNYLGANALIVGSYFKKEGYWANSIDPDRVRRFMDHIGRLRD